MEGVIETSGVDNESCKGGSWFEDVSPSGTWYRWVLLYMNKSFLECFRYMRMLCHLKKHLVVWGEVVTREVEARPWC